MQSMHDSHPGGRRVADPSIIINREDRHTVTIAVLTAALTVGAMHLLTDAAAAAERVGATFTLRVRPRWTTAKITGAAWTPGADNYTTLPWAGETYTVGTLPYGAFHPLPSPHARRACGCAACYSADRCRRCDGTGEENLGVAVVQCGDCHGTGR